MRDAESSRAHDRKVWVSLLNATCMALPDYEGICHYYVDAGAAVVAHDGQVAVAAPRTLRSHGGLIHQWLGLDPVLSKPLSGVDDFPICIIPLRIRVRSDYWR